MYMYWADEMVPKRDNGHAANRRLTRYIMLASLPLIDIPMFIIIYMYHPTHKLHVHAGVIS